MQRSRACKLCRTRRIKCDESKPSCLKCRKAKRACPGYWNPSEITIRDETEATIRKATLTTPRHADPGRQQESLAPWSQADPIQSRGLTSQHSASTSINLLSRGLSPSWMSSALGSTDISTDREFGTNFVILYTLQTPVDDQATCFFLSNFVMMPHNGDGKGYLAFIPRMLALLPARGSPFPLCFKAAATTALAGRANSKPLLAKARMYYSLALHQLNRVLSDQKTPKNDDLCLASVILLSFCEVCWG